MISLIFNLCSLVVVMVCIFVITRKLVMMWTGSTKEEATKKIQNFVFQKEEYHIGSDQMLITDIWNAVNNIIGDARYEELRRLSRTSHLFYTNYASGLPYVAVTVPYSGENEKLRLENIIRDIVSTYLSIHGLYNGVLLDWKENVYVKMPALMIRYAETEEQLKILNACLHEEKTRIIIKSQPLKDDEI